MIPLAQILNGANVASAAITLAVLIGIALRHNRKIHPTLMSACFGADLALVVWLELSREAIEKATSNLSPLMVTHIALATLMLVLYGVLIYSGVKMLRAGPTLNEAAEPHRRRHQVGAILFVLVRVAVLVTAVMVAGGADAKPGGRSPDGTKSVPAEREIPQKGSGRTLP